MALRRPVPVQQDALRRSHLGELENHVTAKGIWVDMPALYAFPRRGAKDRWAELEASAYRPKAR